MDNNKSFEEICYDFQKNIINIFNEEKNLTLLLKYYLFKDIWADIEKNKIQLDQTMNQKEAQKAAETPSEEPKSDD
jgi:hypothetical protein